jgi:predicted kinase
VARQLILVNGLPASGKTTLARALGIELGIPVVSKDAVKEPLADITGTTVGSTALGALASETMWRLAGLVPGRAIVESWWFAPRDLDFVRKGLSTAGNPAIVEVWCDVPPEHAWQRYLARERHAIHPAGQSSFGPWAEWMKNPRPLELGTVVRVQTDTHADIAALAARLEDQFAREIAR